jgi:hypothetical protein
MFSRLVRLTFEQSSITKVYEVVKAYNKNKMTEVPENRRRVIKILYFNSYYLPAGAVELSNPSSVPVSIE